MADIADPTNPVNPNSAGIKDTLESILIALILAFVFRAFFVEAFVIPTGSMAPTLLGAHMRFRCQDCGWDFTANYSGASSQQGSDDIVIPNQAVTVVQRRDARGQLLYDAAGKPLGVQVPQVFSLTCPNCGHKVQRNDPSDPANDATSPPVYYGDRILVLKYAYLMESPKRWDVIVFRSPYDQGDNYPQRPANQPEFQQNYIKRLIGLPGEQIMLLDGDVYARAADAQPWQIQHKPKTAQDALWRIISDLDHQPRGIPRGAEPAYAPPWATPAGTQGFNVEPGGRAYTSAPGTTSALRFDDAANPRKFSLTDWMVFNTTQPQQNTETGRPADPEQFGYFDRGANLHNVSDLQLRLTYQRLSGTGPLDLSLTKRSHRFTARFLPDRAQLLHVLPDGKEEVIGTHPLSTSASTLDIEFQNVDYRVALRINGREVIVSTPAQYAPDVSALRKDYDDRRIPPRPEVAITSQDHAARLSHLSLWRDIYYISDGQNTGRGLPWASPDGPIVLGKGEYFPLGDNSALSLDGRFWKAPIDLPAEGLYTESGRVPERFMLGKAFFVYWPAGYRFSEGSYGVIPNFGLMRLIH